MNKQGGFTDLFIFMIVAFVIVLFSIIFIYISGQVNDELEEQLPKMNLVGDGNNNASVVLENTLGKFNASITSLQWISVFLIFGMIIAIFIGSYLVTTKPIFFIPYIFIVIIAVIVAVPISNAYETLYDNATLNSTFTGFIGANWIMSQLPVIIAIVGITGGIIMFVRMGKREEVYYGY
jgi:hypothetical protein